MQHFAIIAMPRSGSTRLCDILGRHPAVACHLEIFHPSEVQAHLPADTGLEVMDVAKRDANPKLFLDKFLAFNDLVALGLMTRLRQLGIDVPRDLSIAGFDDVPMAGFATPSLTSMSVPRGEIGAQVWARLRTLIAGGPIEHSVLYRPRLEARESTGPVA